MVDFSKIKLNSGSQDFSSSSSDDEKLLKETVEKESSLRLSRLRVSGSNTSFEEISSSSEEGEGPANPLLEDDEEEEEGARPQVSRSAEGGIEEGDAFDEQLEDLLGDDDELFTPNPEGGQAQGSIAPEKKVRSHSNRAAKEKKRLRAHSRSSSYKKAKGGLSSDYARRGAVEYLVDGTGELVRAGVKSAEDFDKLVQAAESHSVVPVSDRFASEAREASTVVGDEEVRGEVLYPWAVGGGKAPGGGAPKERLGRAELEVFKNLGVSKNSFVRGMASLEDVRAPATGRHSGKRKVKSKNLEAKAVGGAAGYAHDRAPGVRLMDFDVLLFLAKFKYASSKQLSALRGVKELTMTKQLRELQRKGLVEQLELFGASPTWYLTAAGMVLSGYDLPLVKQDKVSYMLVPHQFTVNNTAANLWGGGVNVLNLDEFPLRNRWDANGKNVWGEVVVSETEMQSSFAKLRKLSGSDVYRPKVEAALSSEFRAWEEAGGAPAGLDSPEFSPGNEFMWILFPPYTLRTAFHFPDLAVARKRNLDGTPESIAVEVELDSKPKERYIKTLEAYFYDTRIYKKVIWVCKSLQAAKALEEAAKDIGLWQAGRIDIVPILTEEGIFEGKNMWKI